MGNQMRACPVSIGGVVGEQFTEIKSLEKVAPQI